MSMPATEVPAARPRLDPALAFVCVAALAARVGLAAAFPNVLWPDEIFQTLEQAHRLVFGYGVIPWEFREGTRSWLLPGLIAPAMAAVHWAGGVAHVHAAQVLLSLASLVPVCGAAVWARPLGRGPALAAAIGCAGWFDLLLYAPKALAEAVAAVPLVLGLLLARPRDRSAGALAWAGAALALAVALRLQLAPAVAVAAVMVARGDLRAWRALALGAAPVVVAAGALDAVTWSAPFHSYLANVRVNLVEGRSAAFGVEPWWFYLAAVPAEWGWAAPALLALAALGARRRPELAATALVVVAAHSAIPHKELRFVFPAVVLVVVLAALGTAEAVAWVARRGRFSSGRAALAAGMLWTGTSAAVAWGSPRWHAGASLLEATRLAGGVDTCGVALLGVRWPFTGGYTYLHRDVPLYVIDDPLVARRAWPGFNVALVPAEVAGRIPGYQAVRCWDDVCVVRRPGGCGEVPVPAINARLAMTGE